MAASAEPKSKGAARRARSARAALANPSGTVLVSAASAWETCTKYRIGKLPGADGIARDFEKEVIGGGFGLLPITTRHAHEATACSSRRR